MTTQYEDYNIYKSINQSSCIKQSFVPVFGNSSAKYILGEY